VVAELFHVDGRTDTRTDRHDEANSHLSQFFERASNLRFFLLLPRPQPRYNTFEQILPNITFQASYYCSHSVRRHDLCHVNNLFCCPQLFDCFNSHKIDTFDISELHFPSVIQIIASFYKTVSMGKSKCPQKRSEPCGCSPLQVFTCCVMYASVYVITPCGNCSLNIPKHWMFMIILPLIRIWHWRVHLAQKRSPSP
jgi:hypothetical protein